MDQMSPQQVVVPAAVSDYQKYMKHLDLMDQMIGYYIIEHREVIAICFTDGNKDDGACQKIRT